MIPNSVLFEGGPGTGKTTEAKIIGKYLGYPFIYIPVGKIVSKWYGESEKKLDTILELARKAGEQYGGVVVMIDEIDEIGLNRDSAHEATGRITGVLLKKLDGMEKIDNLLLIGSTNRMTSMDPALLSRFSQIINFPVPAREDIRCIFQHYIPDAASVLDEVLMKLENRS
jgi:transitional endoplasmic reticulum ATPase